MKKPTIVIDRTDIPRRKMYLKKGSIFISLLFSLFVFATMAIAMQSPPPGHELKVFKELLTNINAYFVFPEGFNEVKPIKNEKFPCQYALQLPDNDFEIRFQVNQLKSEWRNYEQEKGDRTNPDSLYNKQAIAEAKSLAGTDGKYFARNIPPSVLQQYNADLGKSYFLTLADSPETNHYQYALMVVLQKNHDGNIIVVCFGNERGPAFFKNINKLKDCLKFNN